MKKHFNNILSLLVLFLIINSCIFKGKKKIDEVNNLNIKQLDFTDIEKNKVNQLSISESMYIPLETNDNCLIGSVDKIFIQKDRIFILDRKYAKVLYVFDITGKFLFKIGQIGKGPSEFINLNDFDIDIDGNIYMHDQATRKIVKFNQKGIFIEYFRYDFFISAIQVLDKDRFLFYRGNHAQKINDKFQYLSNNTLVYWTKNKNEVSIAFFPYRGMNVENSGSTRIYRSGTKIYFHRNYDDIIYEINPEGINGRYEILLKNDRLSEMELTSLESTEVRSLFREGKLGLQIDHFFENEDFLSFTIFDLKIRKTWYCLYSKKSGNIKTAYTLDTKNEKFNILGSIVPWGIYNKYFYVVIEGMALEAYIDQALKQDKYFMNYYGHLDVIDTLKQMKPGSNPIITMYKFDDF